MNATSKLVKAWESKNAKNAAKAGGISLMALSLAACGGSDSTTTAVVADPVTPVTPVVPVTPVANSFVLTTGMDQVTGAAGDDTVYATVSAAATTTTLEAFDRIDLGLGTDTMVVTLSGGDFVDAATLSGIEVFQVQASGAARAFDADGLEGMTSFVNHRGSDDLTVTNMESVSTVISLDRISSADTTSVTFKNAALAGTSDNVTVDVNRVTAAENITLTSSGVNDIETVTIHSTGSVANTIGTLLVDDSANNDVMTKLVITGDQDLDADAGDMDFAGTATTDTATVDASGMSGTLLLDLDDADTNVRHDVTGGTGNDTFDMGDSLDANDTIDGGAGTDTVLVDSIADGATVTLASSYNLSNVENLQVAAAATATYTVNASGQAGLEKIAVVENATSGNVTLSNLAADVSVELQNSVNGADIDTVTVSLLDATGSADALDVTLKGTAGHGTDNDVADLALSNIETLNITSAYMGTTALGAAEANDISDISADTSLTKITVSGTEKTILSVGSEASNLATVDASAAADDFTVDISAFAASSTVTGGAGNDTFTMGTRLAAGDSVDGGGNRTVAGDTLTATVTGLTATTGVLSVANVENVDLTNNGTAVLNVAAVTGTSAINLFASSD
ncbi:hypothetical protein N8386_01425, partial [Planktomarina temperata]|nr:hypothetical protein [Planktomarina temperata]